MRKETKILGQDSPIGWGIKRRTLALLAHFASTAIRVWLLGTDATSSFPNPFLSLPNP